MTLNDLWLAVRPWTWTLLVAPGFHPEAEWVGYQATFRLHPAIAG